jgi:hypothetical protein
MRAGRWGVALTLAAMWLAGPAYAGTGGAQVQHLAFSFDEEPVSTQVEGLGRGCPDFTGVLEERRHLDAVGIMKADGSGHARTDVAATVTLTPDDPNGTSYTGGYRQHQAGSFVAGGTEDRVVTTTMHGTISGSDGSSYLITEVVHFSVDSAGEVRAWIDRFHCG